MYHLFISDRQKSFEDFMRLYGVTKKPTPHPETEVIPETQVPPSNTDDIPETRTEVAEEAQTPEIPIVPLEQEQPASKKIRLGECKYITH